MTWNHPPNQQLYGTEQAIRTLLSLLSPAGRAAAIGSSWAAPSAASKGGGPVTDASKLAPAVAEMSPEAASHASELTLYSMMALVNLSYNNERVQELVRACGGVPLIQQQLSSPPAFAYAFSYS